MPTRPPDHQVRWLGGNIWNIWDYRKKSRGQGIQAIAQDTFNHDTLFLYYEDRFLIEDLIGEA